MENFNIKYFLASNSCEGFVSFFGSCYDPHDNWKAYIIKGGPGTGKSSFMKFLAAKASDKGIKTVLCPCSSDPDSLDAVIFPEIKKVVLDGTSPHTLDPKFPAVCEEILNFGEFWQTEKITPHREQILSLCETNSSLHRTAARYLYAAGELVRDSLKIASACTKTENALKTAEKLCKKLIPQTHKKCFEWVRFTCGVTPKGVISFTNTLLSSAENLVIINDPHGAASNIIMTKIRDHALKCGYEIISVKNSFLPNTLLDHILIPELSLCFARESEYQHFETTARRIHARRFTDMHALNLSRERLRFNKKVAREMLSEACTTLLKAKTVHDDIEKHYISAMDFVSLTAFAETFAEKILKI